MSGNATRPTRPLPNYRLVLCAVPHPQAAIQNSHPDVFLAPSPDVRLSRQLPMTQTPWASNTTSSDLTASSYAAGIHGASVNVTSPGPEDVTGHYLNFSYWLTRFEGREFER